MGRTRQTHACGLSALGLIMADPDAIQVGVDFSPAITAGLTAFGDVVKLTDDELAILNSPLNIQARLNVAIQAAKDRLAKDAQDALRAGNMSDVNRDLS